jgi:hypothetical protein
MDSSEFESLVLGSSLARANTLRNVGPSGGARSSSGSPHIFLTDLFGAKFVFLGRVL